MNGNLTLTLLSNANVTKNNHLQKCIFLTIKLWTTSHISHWTQSRRFFVSSIQGFWKMLQVTASSSFSLLLSPFDDSAKLLDWSGGPGCCFSRGISSLTAVLYGIFFPLPHISNFLALFWFKKNVSVLFIEILSVSCCP